MAQRYGVLPSEAISRASTFDLVIMDSAMALENHANQANTSGYVPPLTTEELLKIKERV
jgi:hypothetical protein